MGSLLFSGRYFRNEEALERFEKQLFRDVQQLIRYKDGYQRVRPQEDAVINSFEQRIQDRCDVLSVLGRR